MLPLTVRAYLQDFGKRGWWAQSAFFQFNFFVVVATNRKSKLKRSERVSSKGEENRRSQEAELELKMKMMRFGGLGFLLLLPLWFWAASSSSKNSTFLLLYQTLCYESLPHWFLYRRAAIFALLRQLGFFFVYFRCGGFFGFIIYPLFFTFELFFFLILVTNTKLTCKAKKTDIHKWQVFFKFFTY